MTAFYRLAWLLLPLAIVAGVGFFLHAVTASLTAGMGQ